MLLDPHLPPLPNTTAEKKPSPIPTGHHPSVPHAANPSEAEAEAATTWPWMRQRGGGGYDGVLPSSLPLPVVGFLRIAAALHRILIPPAPWSLPPEPLPNTPRSPWHPPTQSCLHRRPATRLHLLPYELHLCPHHNDDEAVGRTDPAGQHWGGADPA